MVADKFPRKYVVQRGRDQAFMISSWPGVAQYLGVSVSTAMRMAERIEDPLPVLRSDAIRGVWIEESILRAWMERNGLSRPPAIEPS